MAESKVNVDSIQANAPISTSAQRDNGTGPQSTHIEHNKVRTQAPTQDAPENTVEVHPAAGGVNAPKDAKVVNPEDNAAQINVDQGAAGGTETKASDTLTGATSGDFAASIGHPVGGVSSNEAHHPGHATENAAKDRTVNNSTLENDHEPNQSSGFPGDRK